MTRGGDAAEETRDETANQRGIGRGELAKTKSRGSKWHEEGGEKEKREAEGEEKGTTRREERAKRQGRRRRGEHLQVGEKNGSNREQQWQAEHPSRRRFGEGASEERVGHCSGAAEVPRAVSACSGWRVRPPKGTQVGTLAAPGTRQHFSCLLGSAGGLWPARAPLCLAGALISSVAVRFDALIRVLRLIARRGLAAGLLDCKSCSCLSLRLCSNYARLCRACPLAAAVWEVLLVVASNPVASNSLACARGMSLSPVASRIVRSPSLRDTPASTAPSLAPAFSDNPQRPS